MAAEKVQSLKSLVETIALDLEKFEAGNKAAGTRVRKACQDIKKTAQDLRVEVQSKKNAE